MNETAIKENKIKSWVKRHSESIGILGVLTGIVIGFGIPIWQIYWVDTPTLAIEFNGINRKISPEASIPVENEALAPLIENNTSRFNRRRIYIEDDSGRIIRKSQKKGKGLSPVVVDDLLTDAKRELKELPERLESRKKELSKIETFRPENVSIKDVQGANFPLQDEVEYDPTIFQKNAGDRQKNIPYFQDIIDKFLAKYQKRSEETEKRYTLLQSKLPAAERAIEALNKELLEKRSFFKISAVLINSGRSTISIKQPALLRIYIGTGNYVDLKLILDEYRETAEVKEHGTQIVTFISKEISSLPESDQNLINTYWGQSVHSILYVEDTSGNIQSSNRIAFAEGLYQKIIYDRLASEAAKKKYFEPVP